MKNIIIIIGWLAIAVLTSAQGIGSAPTVSDVSMEQVGAQVHINYNLRYSEDLTTPYAANNDPAPELFVNQENHHNPVPINVTIVISEDSGQTYKRYADPANLHGDVENVEPGPNKQIIWNITNEYPDIVGNSFRVRVIARRSDESVFVERGTYNNTQNDVTLTRDFYVNRHIVTQEEYRAVMNYNPSNFGGVSTRPVERVSWFDAIEYCNRRSLQEGLTPVYSYTVGEDRYGTNPDDWPEGWNLSDDNHLYVVADWNPGRANGYRLPTEAEWEWAARGGVPAIDAGTINSTYSGGNNPYEVAWFDHSRLEYRTHIVGKRKSNELGIYDLSGNVFEWQWDIYDDTRPSGTDPTGPETGWSPMFRGGCYFNTIMHCEIAWRQFVLAVGATVSDSNIGFRVYRGIPQ